MKETFDYKKWQSFYRNKEKHENRETKQKELNSSYKISQLIAKCDKLHSIGGTLIFLKKSDSF